MKILILISIIILGLIITITPAFAKISDSLDSFYTYDIQTGELAIMWLGPHQKGPSQGYASAGFLLKTSNHIVAIDPSSILLGNIDSLDRLDVIFITHEHGDHFDPDTTTAMQTKTGSLVVTDLTSASMLSEIPEDKIIQIESNEQMTISEITVKALEAEHPTATPLVYLIELDGIRIFHGSDSGFVEELKNIESRVHVSLVPVGDPSPTAAPQVAFNMTKVTKPNFAIPMHGIPEQMHFFSELVEESELETTVTIPSPLQLMILSEDLMKIERISELTPKIPEWVRNIFIWYGEDKISEDELIGALQYLIQEGIIKV